MPQDPYAGLNRTIVELPLTVGLSNNFTESFRAAPKDALSVINNAELTSVGKFATRSGFVSLSNTRIGSESGFTNLAGYWTKLFARPRELGAIAATPFAIQQDAGWGTCGDCLYTYEPNINTGAAWRAHGKIPRPTLSCLPNIGADRTPGIADCAVTADGKFALICWHSQGDWTQSQIGAVYFRVVDTATGAIVIDNTAFPINYAGRTANASPGVQFLAKLQCLAVGSIFSMFVYCQSGFSSSANNIYGVQLDMSVANPVVGAPVTLGATVSGFGVATDGASIFVAYNGTGSSAVTLTKYNAALGLLAGPVTCHNYGQQLSDVNIDAGSGEVAVATVTADRLTFNLETFATSNLAQVNTTAVLMSEVAAIIYRPDVLILAANRYAVASARHSSPTVSAVDGAVFWGVATASAGAVNALGLKARSGGIINLGHMSNVNGNVYMPVVKCDRSPELGWGIDPGYFLLQLDMTNFTSNTRTPMLAAHWATDVSAPVLDSNNLRVVQQNQIGPTVGIIVDLALMRGAVIGNKYFCVTRKGAAIGDSPLPQFSAYALDLITCDFADVYRQQSRNFGERSVFAGAVPFAYDGRRTFEQGTVRPRIVMLQNAINAGGKIVPGAVYYFRVVYTWQDSTSDQWLSAPSFAQRTGDVYTVTMPDRAIGIVTAIGPNTGTTQTITVTTTSGLLSSIVTGAGGTVLETVHAPFVGVSPTTIFIPSTLITSVNTSTGLISYSFPGPGSPVTVANVQVGDRIYVQGAFVATQENSINLSATLPPCFSGMYNGTDLFLNPVITSIYMTQNAGPTSVYFLAKSVNVGSSTAAYGGNAVFTVLILQEALASSEQIYVAGGELENSAPPPARSIEVHRDRVFAISSYDNRVYYTKPSNPGRGVEWAQLTQYIVIPETGLGLASNETCLIVFTTRGVYAIEGYGPSATGQPAQAFGTLQCISNNMGLYEVNSCKSTHIGVFFRTSYGWWLVDRTLTLTFIGNDINGMVLAAAQTIAISVDNVQACIRILTRAGAALGDYQSFNYWYDSQRWSTDSNSPGRAGAKYLDAVVQNDNYFILDESDVLQRQPLINGQPFDGSRDQQGYGMTVSTGWITLANLAMYKRIWRVIATIENLTNTAAVNPALQLIVYADWSTSASLVKTFTADQIGPGIQTLRAHLPVQKMKAIKIVLQTVAQSAVFADNNVFGYNFIGFGFEIGLKNRLSPEPAGRST